MAHIYMKLKIDSFKSRKYSIYYCNNYFYIECRRTGKRSNKFPVANVSFDKGRMMYQELKRLHGSDRELLDSHCSHIIRTKVKL